jgi:serine/threonine protein kinase
MSSIEKFSYALSHREFYESLDQYVADENTYLKLVRGLLPKEWSIVRNSIFFHCIPPNYSLLEQGWKIHISAVIRNAADVLRDVVPILAEDGTAFKFVLDPSVLFLVVGKRWFRGGAGKFLTIYPRSLEHFKTLIERLHQATLRHKGPYILSDRRYKDSKCVFYRYGGIQMRSLLTVKGDRTPFIVSPGGEKVQDQRRAMFSMPEWMSDPFPEDAPAPNNDLSLNNGRYVVQSSLRFSNSGGLYLAVDRHTGSTVVIKEARPLTNVDDFGRDAVQLLKKEYRILKTLESSGIAPRPIDLFEEWEHTFMVQEYLEGPTLRQHAVLRNVTRSTNPTPEYLHEFLGNFVSLFSRMVEILRVLREHKIVYGDFSPTNGIVCKDGLVRILDFEAACQLGVDQRGRLFTPGFAAADHFLGDVPQYEIDYYGVGALMLSYLMPIHAILGLEPEANERFICSIGDDYGLPDSLLQLIRKLMSTNPTERPGPEEVLQILQNLSPLRKPKIFEPEPWNPAEISRVIDGTMKYMAQSTTYHRQDRLLPLDPKVFATNPLNLAYGASGVLYAMHKIKGGIPGEMHEWVLKQDVSSDRYPPGLYVGMAGVAWTLLSLGHRVQAEEIMARSKTHPLLTEASDIYYGLAGWGMAQLKFYLECGSREYLENAVFAGDELVRTSLMTPQGLRWGKKSELKFGFAHGSSGIALFLLYLYLATKNDLYLRVGQEALDFDLNNGVRMAGSLLWPTHAGEDRSLVPYWRYGSAGVGTVLLRYYQLLRTERYKSLLDEIRLEMDRKHAIYPGRGFGLASLGELLLDLAQANFDRETCIRLARKVASGIMLFQLDKGERGIAFPGADLWKISCDYFSGSAGVALFLHRLLNGGPADFMLDELLDTTDHLSRTSQQQRSLEVIGV